jgi:3-oxoadipate enol-lactonase
MQRLEANGETLSYARAGTGRPLLLIHSLGTAAWLWREQIRRWQDRRDVIAVEARGHGGSSNRGGFDVRRVAEDCLALKAALGLGALDVVAISMGGPIVAHLVDLDPAAVRRLVIADSFATQGAAGAERAAGIAAKIEAEGIEAFGRFYARDTLDENHPDALFDELASSIGAMRPSDYVEAARSVFTSDVTALLAKVAVPTRVVVGSRDQRTPPALSEAIAALVPGATLERIEGARHLANLDRPDGFHAAVDPFLFAET